MALLSRKERELIRLILAGPNTDSQRRSLLRELQADDDSVADDAVDTRFAIKRHQ